MKIEKNVDDVELEKGHVYVFRDSHLFSLSIKIDSQWLVFQDSLIRGEELSLSNFFMFYQSCPSEQKSFYTFNLENSDED